MYKATHNNHDYMTKTGSHSLTASRKGYMDVGVLIDESEIIAHPEEVRRQLAKLRQSLEMERRELEVDLIPLRSKPQYWRRNAAHRYKGKEYLFSENKEKINKLKRWFYLGDLIQDCQRKAKELPKPELGLPELFMNEAERILDAEVFGRIMKNAKERFLG